MPGPGLSRQFDSLLSPDGDAGDRLGACVRVTPQKKNKAVSARLFLLLRPSEHLVIFLNSLTC